MGGAGYQDAAAAPVDGHVLVIAHPSIRRFLCIISECLAAGEQSGIICRGISRER